ncbi:MAG: DnaD domain protein [Lachnospiraceae bacterium]|nr:DnaD domain protein [Lachnospiraceae bacterium]
MQTITISTANSETYSSISNFFIDYYMTEANGEFVKVYLYLARQLGRGQAITVASIADHFNLTQKDICRAIKYWVSKDVLRLSYDGKGNLCGIVLLPLSAPIANQLADDDIDSILQAPTPTRLPVPTDTIAVSESFSETKESDDIELAVPPKQKQTQSAIDSKLSDPNWEIISHEFETLFGKPMSATDLQTLLYIYDTLDFDIDLFEYLIEYCVMMGKKNCRYMETVAIAWYKDGIKTKQQAKEQHSMTAGIAKTVFKALGIRRAMPTTIENAYITTWSKDFGFSVEIIEEACMRGIAQKPNSVNFAYINGILENWHKKGVKTFADIERVDKEFFSASKRTARTAVRTAGGVNDFKQTKLDDQLDEMEQLLLTEINHG